MCYKERMQTAKPNTKKELVDIEKIRKFTADELALLSKSGMPLCYQVGANTLFVGRFKVVKINEKCWSVIENNTEIGEFFMRKNAIVYCIALHINKFADAHAIRKIDTGIGNLDFDAILYRYRYKTALSSKDEWKASLFSDRYTETMLQMTQLKEDLKKLIIFGKYIK